MDKRYFKVLLDCGHMGRRKSIEVNQHVVAKDCVDAFIIGNRMPRVKRKDKHTGALKVVEISFNEYHSGLALEAVHPYLRIHRNSAKKGGISFGSWLRRRNQCYM